MVSPTLFSKIISWPSAGADQRLETGLWCLAGLVTTPALSQQLCDLGKLHNYTLL